MSRNFRKVLKYCRHLAGRSQLELALDAGVSARHLSFLESGRADPGRDVVAKLAAAMAISDTARNALFVAAGFSPAPSAAQEPPSRLALLERMLAHRDPCPSALTDAHGKVLATNVSMRALHVALTGTVSDLRALSAAELAFGARGFGPFLENRDALERRFTHCRALERLIAGQAVDQPASDAGSTTAAAMQFEDRFGALKFGLIETSVGHPLHGLENAMRIYSMVPADRQTEAAVSRMVDRHKTALIIGGEDALSTTAVLAPRLSARTAARRA